MKRQYRFNRNNASGFEPLLEISNLMRCGRGGSIGRLFDMRGGEISKKEVCEEYAKRIISTGGDALKAGKIKPAKEAIAYAEKLAEFVKKIQKLGDDWRKLEAKIDAAAPEVKEIVLPTNAVKAHKTGYMRKVEKVGPKTNFTVSFPDGTRIADKKAYWVLARTIEKMGAEKVAAFAD